jgi:archaeosine synthase beta-subunit
MISRPAAAAGFAADVATEIFPDGQPHPIGTVYLRNGACPLACVYCALYRQAGPGVATGDEIAAQIRSARARLPAIDGIKLYNASSLFEPRSIRQTAEDRRAIAAAVEDLPLVVIEARSENARHALDLAPLLRGRLEVAIGLEVADDALLRRLGKPTSVTRFRKAASLLQGASISLRAFVLVQPPFVRGEESHRLAVATFERAREEGARVVSLLPVVSEHAPMERLREEGSFIEISIEDYYAVVAACVRSGGPVVLAETAVLHRLPGCSACRERRAAALASLNATGSLHPVECPLCAGISRGFSRAGKTG